MLTVVDEFTRESLAIRVDRRLNSTAVIETLAELMLERGTPGHIRSDNVLCREARGRLGRRSPRTGENQHVISVSQAASAVKEWSLP
jgi:hypothetical protein